jgi:hypothetical protein
MVVDLRKLCNLVKVKIFVEPNVTKQSRAEVCLFLGLLLIANEALVLGIRRVIGPYLYSVYDGACQHVQTCRQGEMCGYVRYIQRILTKSYIIN